MDKKWYADSYRRNLVDMHIEDWDETFLSQFDPDEYVALLVKAQVQSAMIYANSHVGYCYWPTETGHMHRGFKGRDLLGELIDKCHDAGMDVVIYYSLIYNNWASDGNPTWRVVGADGKATRQPGDDGTTQGRYGTCCPNSEYGAFALAQIREFCSRYDFEGIFYDMTFWPIVCYCPACRQRFAEEVGGDIPTTIDWDNPTWVSFQHKREDWLTEFANATTESARASKPGVTIEHQFSTAAHPWTRGTTLDIVNASDYAGGDFYGGIPEQSFICKLYYSTTPNMPFEFMTSRCYPNLQDHTTTKSREALYMHNAIALAHGGAFMFIDAIDPVGTLNPGVYETMGGIFQETKGLEQHLGGSMCQDVAVYFSLDSKFNPVESGNRAATGSAGTPHLAAALGAARTLRESHIPFGVISEGNLDGDLRHQIIILPDVLALNAHEAERIRLFVAGGGSLYASGRTSPTLLADVFGFEHVGETKEAMTYMTPTSEGESALPDLNPDYPLTIFGKQQKVNGVEPAHVLATVTLPYTDPANASVFSSIHSNPPGPKTSYPAILSRTYGAGRVVWCAAPIEAAEQLPHRRTFARLVRGLATKGFTFEADAPEVVEVVAFHQPDRSRYVVSLLNEQQEQLAPVPVADIRLRLNLNGRPAARAVLLPEGTELDLEVEGGYAQVSVTALTAFMMVAVEYGA